jgi:phosphatidylglycerol---prolipoprotein diacylglyceryl transferase
MILGIAFKLGPISVAWYGIFIALGVVAAVAVAAWEAKRRGESVDHLINMLFLILPLGIIGARLYHVIDQWSYYSQYPSQIIGGRGLGIYGAVIGGAIGLIIYALWKKLIILRWLDIVAPGLILAQAIGRWGNYFNQELFGYPTNLPWGVYISPENRPPQFANYSHFQPLFLYESLLNLIGFGLLLFIARRFKNRLLEGEIFGFYLIYYGIVRFILEGYKIEVWKLAGIPTARWIAGAGILIVVAVTIYRRLRRPKNDVNSQGESKENGISDNKED